MTVTEADIFGEADVRSANAPAGAAAGAGAGFALDAVGVRYGPTVALDGVSLAIAPGERVGLVGPSGAGKTTLLRLLNGSVRATSGTVTAGGQVIGSLSPRALRRLRSRIGFVHQDLSLLPNQRVIRNVLLGKLGQRSLLGATRILLFPTRREAVDVHALLERVGVGDKLYERTDRLSGGQQQRVAVARALYQDPIALLADEPVASVDPARARDTVALLAGISRERGLTLCMSLHNLDLARAYFPRLIGLRRGRVVFDARADALDEAQFRSLYDLGREEMLEDGTGA